MSGINPGPSDQQEPEAVAPFREARPSVPEEGFNCFWLVEDGRYVGQLNGPQDDPAVIARVQHWDRPVSLDREAIGRRLYDCEKQRGERAQSVMAAAYGKPCHGILMEPWDECKDSFLSDADAIIALIEGRT